MGYWGTEIYANDIAEDLKLACEDIFSFVSVEEGNKILEKHFSEYFASDITDNEIASFWYALADWQLKHGILSNKFKDRVIDLLKSRAGIEEWAENENKETVKKRIEVMDKLLARLSSEQSPQKIVRKKAKTPKHQIGDIIIFKLSHGEKYNFEFDDWKIIKYYSPFIFKEKNDHSLNGTINIDQKFCLESYDKYYAILCVGKARIQHSEYLEEIFDEYSVYAFYDYCDFEKPTVEKLNLCGFLPYINWKLKDFNFNITQSAEWGYRFFTYDKFRKNRGSYILDFSKEKSKSEVERFDRSLENKNYFCGEINCVELYDAFRECWEPKVFLHSVNRDIDNLQNLNSINPELLSPNELDKEWAKWLKKVN